MKNILFVAAHPDDELVGATFIIKRLLQKNLFIFFLTNGVISKEEMWFWNKKKYKEKKKNKK